VMVAGCHQSDPAARERVVERDQLRREVTGLRALQKLAPGKIMDREHEAIVSVSDTLLRELLVAAFPITVELPNRIAVTLTGATVVFRANVARVEIVGQARRTRFPHVSASVFLRGALDGFVVKESQSLRARISVDDVSLDTPAGAPASLDPLVINALQYIIERGLPELTASLPAVTIPVRLDQAMSLPGFGPEGAFAIQPSRAPMTIQASRVIAFQNRLWMILRVDLGEFVSVPDTSP
jgi:hypothetical protein